MPVSVKSQGCTRASVTNFIRLSLDIGLLFARRICASAFVDKHHFEINSISLALLFLLHSIRVHVCIAILGFSFEHYSDTFFDKLEATALFSPFLFFDKTLLLLKRFQ